MNLLLSTTQKNICNHQRKLQAHVLIPRFFPTYIYLLCQFNGVPFAFIVAQEKKKGKEKRKILILKQSLIENQKLISIMGG